MQKKKNSLSFLLFFIVIAGYFIIVVGDKTEGKQYKVDSSLWSCYLHLHTQLSRNYQPIHDYIEGHPSFSNTPPQISKFQLQGFYEGVAIDSCWKQINQTKSFQSMQLVNERLVIYLLKSITKSSAYSVKSTYEKHLLIVSTDTAWQLSTLIPNEQIVYHEHINDTMVYAISNATSYIKP